MKKKILIILLILIMPLCLVFTGCSLAETATYNIQKDADYFRVCRRMTFINLYTGELLYSAEGYFSVQTTYKNAYQGQQEIGLVFKVSATEYKMHYFSINQHTAYVIEQIENTTTNPYFWKIIWYIPLPTFESA